MINWAVGITEKPYVAVFLNFHYDLKVKSSCLPKKATEESHGA